MLTTDTMSATDRRLWPPLVSLLLVFSLHQETSSTVVSQGSLYQVSEFLTPLANSSFRHLVVNTETQDLYIGAANFIYSLDKDLHQLQVVRTGPQLDNKMCPPPIAGMTCREDKKLLTNYNKVLVIDYVGKRLIACGTVFHGFCERRRLDNITIHDKHDLQFSVVGNNESTSTVAFIAPGPITDEENIQRNVLYVAVSPVGELYSQQDIPAFASRNLSEFELAYKEVVTSIQTSVTIEAQQRGRFPITYVYGFSSDNFSYMTSVQKQSTEDNAKFMSKLIRVCQNDKRYYSYVEIELLCALDSGNSSKKYNILQTAYVSKPGRDLAMSLDIDMRTDVLFAIFATSASELSYQATNDSALCIFPMSQVRTKFTENIKRCFNGVGKFGGGHLGNSGDCNKNNDIIDDNYCGEAENNQPLAGALPITATPVLTFPSNVATPTSLRVAITHKYTVAFVGTRTGQLVKVSLENNSTAEVYETVSATPTYPILPDMWSDEEEQHLYLLTKKKVVKMKVQACDRYTTCESCLGARDPYCGWCSLENKCSVKRVCQGYDMPRRWLPYKSGRCPRIEKIIPDMVHRDPRPNSQRVLTLKIENLPEFQTKLSYNCVFSPVDSNRRQSAITTVANRTSNNFQCHTPKVSSLPDFGATQDSLVMKLSVQMDGQPLVHDNITFFDCTVHKSCTACTKSQYACTWCIKNHRCTHNADQHCRGDKQISSVLSQEAEKQCPKFEIKSTQKKILVPAGSQRNITVQGYSLDPDFQLDRLQCRFIMNKVLTVPASYSPAPGADVYDITCRQVEFDDIQRIKSKHVDFQILWGDADNPLDNPQGLAVEIYKCDVMASNCGECLLVDPRYACVWCGSKQCQTRAFCTQPTADFCQDVRILNFSPRSGPVKGGTLVTIHGENLGMKEEEVKVQIGLVSCQVVNFQAPSRIECVTDEGDSLSQGKHPVRIAIGNDKNIVTAKSQQMFSFVNPSFHTISPIVGPYAGGTLVTISGRHLNSGSKVTVKVGEDLFCTDPISLNSTALTCVTSALTPVPPMRQSLDVTMTIDDDHLQPVGVKFEYAPNPNVTWVSRQEIIKSGGQLINVSGHHLASVESPELLIWHLDKPFSGECQFTSVPRDNITCITPNITTLDPVFPDYKQLEFGFRMDNVQHLLKLTSSLGKMHVYPEPQLDKLETDVKVHQELLLLLGKGLKPVKPYDVVVQVGTGRCDVSNVVSEAITCKLPSTQPLAVSGSGFPEVVVKLGGNLTYNLGVLQYDKEPDTSKITIIGISVGVAFLFVVVCICCFVCYLRNRRNQDKMKNMRKQMDYLESSVANDCKEAFTELQTDMNELTSDLISGASIPFLDYKTYCMRVLFPDGSCDHPVIRDLEMDYRRREDTERGLKLFFSLIRNKTFLLLFIRTLESQQNFSIRDRVNVASLISVTLQPHMEYATEILKTTLADLIEKAVDNNNEKVLLRRCESIAEKMLSNWFTFLLYRFLKECAGEPLFMLYGAIKQQVSKGPVDAVTSEAKYSLSEGKLIRQSLSSYKSMIINVVDLDRDRCSQSTHPVKVLDVDTISQVKEKILDAIFKSAPFSSRPKNEDLDLVLFVDSIDLIEKQEKSQLPLRQFPSKDADKLVLQDEDNTTIREGEYKRLNTLLHYKVEDQAMVALRSKQASIYNMSIMSEKSKFSDTSYYGNRSPSLNRSGNHQMLNGDVEDCKTYHLVRHQEENKVGGGGERRGKMMSEIYLPRLLITKGTLQSFVDDLFDRIFSTTYRGKVMPLAIKYMFDFLDDQALLHNRQDVVHIWKSNSLPLRFWVNMIQNPDFAFDIYKSQNVDSCLSVISQTFMDSCSIQEQKLTKDSPSGKLLYAKDIPKYRGWVARYYQDIKITPAISDADMAATLSEESRSHANEFNSNAALLELYKYVRKYYDDIVNALEEDEFAKKFKLTYKLDEVSAAMEGNAVC